MSIRKDFLDIKSLYFPRWDRANRWRVSTHSKRRVLGYCDRDRRVIEIVAQHADPDERDRLLIHEICHAVARGSHGKAWQDRMKKAAMRANVLARSRLADMLRQEVAEYQGAAEWEEEAYQTVQGWLVDQPDLTLAQVKRSLTDQYGLLLSEVGTKIKSIEKVYREAKLEAQEARRLREAWSKTSEESFHKGDTMIKSLMVAENVCRLFSHEELARIADTVQHRAQSMAGWGPGQMFVDDYVAADGSVVRFVWQYGADTIRVNLKDNMQFSRPTVQDGNHRVSENSNRVSDPSQEAGTQHLPGKFVPFKG